MKAYTLALGLTILLLGCAETPRRRTTDTTSPQERVSDRYSRSAVRSYDLFHTEIPQHAIMLVRLTTGEQFPMLCRKIGGGIYPIPQSVFAEQGAERWHIMCEPRIHNAHALLSLDLSRVDGGLRIGDRKLKFVAKVPLLSPPSL